MSNFIIRLVYGPHTFVCRCACVSVCVYTHVEFFYYLEKLNREGKHDTCNK